MTNIFSFSVKQSFLRLDQYLVKQLPDYSRSKIQNYIKMGQVTINGMAAKSSLILQGNETIECRFENQPIDNSIIPEQMEIDILYEDDYLAVINKPAGLVVHPGSGNHSGTLLNGLKYHFNNLSRKDSLRPGIVHRLDKETSGAIIVAKNDYSHDQLSKQFNQRQVGKKYQALVWGELKSEGVIDAKIGRHPKKRKIFTIVPNGGRDSCTHYKRIEYSPPLSLVNLKPETGRTHQLRVHLKSISHPIFGDTAYGGGVKNIKSFHIKYSQILNRLFKAIPRLALHARQLDICHPKTGKRMSFTAPFPSDYKTAIKILQNAQL